MAKKAGAAVPSTTAGGGNSTSTGTVSAVPSASIVDAMKARWNGVLSSVGQTVTTVFKNYKSTPQRTKLLDAFLAFIAVVGAIQFIYCVLVGNFVCLFLPAFLHGTPLLPLASINDVMGLVLRMGREGTIVG